MKKLFAIATVVVSVFALSACCGPFWGHPGGGHGGGQGGGHQGGQMQQPHSNGR